MNGIIDVLHREDVQALLEFRSSFAVSIYMPTHRAGREIRQDPIRLKNLLRKAEEILQKEGMRAPEAKELLQPAAALLEDDHFWRYQSDTLALFCAPGFFRYFRLPMRNGELVVVSDRFHLKPLLYFLTHDTRFYLLRLSKKSVELYQGSRESLGRIPAENLPHGMDEILEFEDYERQTQFRPIQVDTGATTAEPAPTHGYYDPGRHEKEVLNQYLNEVAKRVTKMLSELQVPLVVAGVDYVVKLFLQHCKYEHVLEIEGNVEHMNEEQLHAKALEVVQPYIQKQIEKAKDRYYEMKGVEKTANMIPDLLSAAIQGRIDTLFLGVGVQYWGRYEIQNGMVVLDLHKDYRAGDWDITNDIAIYTLLHRGIVYVIEPSEVPDGLPVAAILRY